MQSFALISMLRGRPKTPPSGDDLAVLDYHLKPDSQAGGQVVRRLSLTGYSLYWSTGTSSHAAAATTDTTQPHVLLHGDSLTGPISQSPESHCMALL